MQRRIVKMQISTPPVAADVFSGLNNLTTELNNQQKTVKTANGYLYTCCHDSSAGTSYIFRSIDDGASWGLSFHTETSSSHPSLIADENDIHLFFNRGYSGNNAVWRRHFDYETSTWDVAERLVDSNGGRPIALIDSVGKFHVFWYPYPIYNNYCVYSTNKTGTWVKTNIADTASTGNADGNFSAIIDETDTIHVAYCWYIGTSSGYAINYFTVDAITGTQSIQATLVSGKYYYYPNFRVYNGVLELVYRENYYLAGTGYIYKINVINAALDITTIYTTAFATSTPYLRAPVLCGDYCFWHDNTGTIYYNTKLQSGWTSPVSIESGLNAAAFYNNNTCYVTWANGAKTALRMAKATKELARLIIKDSSGNRLILKGE